jgi:hypothetical protein
MSAKPKLASQAPNDKSTILMNIDWDEVVIIDKGIRITRASIILSINRRDINRCLSLMINPRIADIMQISIMMGIHEFVNILLR